MAGMQRSRRKTQFLCAQLDESINCIPERVSVELVSPQKAPVELISHQSL